MDRRNRWDDAKVGALVLTALAVLVVGSLWLAAGPFGGSARERYRVLMDDSGGLRRGDAVRVAGVLVGKVAGIDLDAGRDRPVALEISVDGSIGLREDAGARVASSGILGDVFLAVEPGKPDSAPLPPGGTLYGHATPGLEDSLARVDEIAERATELLERTTGLVSRLDREMTPLLDRVNALMGEDNVAAIESILSRMRAIAEQAGPRVAPLLERLESLAARAEESLEPMPDVAARLRELLADLRSATGEDGERLRRLLETAESGLADAGDSMAMLADNRRTIELALQDLRDTLANLEAFSRTIKERPFSMIRMKHEPDRKPGDAR